MNNKRSSIQEKWRWHVKDLEGSGQSASAYCREHNLSTQSLCQWRRKFRQENSLKTMSAFVRAEVIHPNSAQSQLPDPKWLATFAVEFIRGLR